MTKLLPIEGWILVALIVEVMVVNWKLIVVSSGNQQHCLSSTTIPSRVWKQAVIPCKELVPTSDIESIVSEPSDFVFYRNPRGAKKDDIVASVAVRIARSVAQRTHSSSSNDSMICKLSFHQATNKPFKSFQWTIVGDPTQQAIDFFFQEAVSHNKVIPNDDTFQQFLFDQQDNVKTPSLDDFNFVGVMERLDESLVVLKLLLNLEMTDLLYLENKHPFELYRNDTCVYQVRQYVSPGMKRFFKSQQWRVIIRHDENLWKAANASLDATINALGRARVEEQVKQYRRLLDKAQSDCKRHALFPCTASGQLQSPQYCHYCSIGCGYACLDRLSNDAVEVA